MDLLNERYAVTSIKLIDTILKRVLLALNDDLDVELKIVLLNKEEHSCNSVIIPIE